MICSTTVVHVNAEGTGVGVARATPGNAVNLLRVGVGRGRRDGMRTHQGPWLPLKGVVARGMWVCVAQAENVKEDDDADY